MSIFGESAKEALTWAKDAYERVVKIEQQIVGVADSVHKYETRSQQTQQAFEARIEQRLASLEASMRADLRDFESRLRLLESQVASLGGKVDGGFAQAASIVLADAAARRDSGIDVVNQHGSGSKPRLGGGLQDT